MRQHTGPSGVHLFVALVLGAFAIGVGVVGYRLVRGQRGTDRTVAPVPKADAVATSRPAASIDPREVEAIALAVLPDVAPGVQAPPPPQLSGEQIARSIKALTFGVKRRCWQPALDAREPGVPPSVRLTFEIEIEPSGSVKSARSLDASPGYPTLPNCIAEVLRHATFPKALGTTTVQVPFVFAAE